MNLNIKNEIKKPIIKNENKISKDNEIDRLKRELKEEKDKNKKLENNINELRTKNNNDTEKYKKEIKVYKEKIEKLSLENNILKDKMKGKSTKNNSDDIVSLYKRIDELNAKLNRYPFILEEGENIMSIVFTSVNQKINYSMICKNTDTINKLESELYKEYPKLAETNYYFICNGTKVNKFKKFEELKIKSGDIIILNEIED